MARKNKQQPATPEEVAAPEGLVPIQADEAADESATEETPSADGEPDPTNLEPEPQDVGDDAVLEDDEEIMEDAEQPATPRKGKAIKALKVEKFKIRHRPWNRRAPLRVVKPFDYDGQSFEVGTVFDWAKAGYKPASVQRLFSRGLLRHIVQDGGVLYPFRAEQVIKKGKKSDVQGYDFLPNARKTAQEVSDVGLTEEERLELNRAKHGIGKAAEDDAPKNFSIKGSHKK